MAELVEISGYKIESVLGYGGLSTVYLAEQESLGRRVALYLGMAQQQTGGFRGSIDAFHRARVLRPDMPEIAFNTGVSWWALGGKRRALGAFLHFMRITDGQRSTYAEQRRRVSQSNLNTPVSN